MMIANDVVGLFPNMKEINTGKSCEKQVLNSTIVVKGVKYREVARYVAGNRKLAGDISEVESVLPWRRKSGKGGKFLMVRPGPVRDDSNTKSSLFSVVTLFLKTTP